MLKSVFIYMFEDRDRYASGKPSKIKGKTMKKGKKRRKE